MKKELNVGVFGRVIARLDTGILESLLEADYLIKPLEKRQVLQVCCSEEIALRNGWINLDKLEEIGLKSKVDMENI